MHRPHFLCFFIFLTGRNSVKSTTVTSSVRLVALLLQHEAAMTSFGGTMAHLTHFGLLRNGGKSYLQEHNNLTLFEMGFKRRKDAQL